MPRPIPVPMRQAMFRLWQKGYGTRQIAESLGLPCSAVRRLLQRFRVHGMDGIPPDYWHPSVPEAAPSDLVETAVSLRREHPTWGAGLIRVQLLLEAPGRPVPSERTLQRWFVRADLSPAPAGRPPRTHLDRAASPHETWQMYAIEHIRIRTREEVSWLRLIDECSGAVLWTAVFPPSGLGRRSPSRPCGNSSAWPGFAGGCPAASESTTAGPGARGAISLPTCRCGSSVWVSGCTGTTRGAPKRTGSSSVPKGRPPGGASRGRAGRLRNCRPAWSEWTACTARSTRTRDVSVASSSSRAWCIPAGPTTGPRRRRGGSGRAWPNT